MIEVERVGEETHKRMTLPEAKQNLIVLACMCNSKGIYDDESAEAVKVAIKSLDAWGKIDDGIASLQDTYSIGNTYTEKLVWENLQAVRKTIHEYLKVVSE